MDEWHRREWHRRRMVHELGELLKANANTLPYENVGVPMALLINLHLVLNASQDSFAAATWTKED